MKCRCGNCMYANEHIDYSTTDIIKCIITGEIHHSRDACDCQDISRVDDIEDHKSLFSIFKMKGKKS